MKKKVILFGVMVFLLFCTGCTGDKSEPEKAVVETMQEVVQDDAQKENIQQKAESTDVSFTEEEINFYRDELKIYGKIYLPKGEGPFPVVIFSHGFPGTHYFADGYAKELTNSGIAGVVFDFIGGSPESKSEGSVTEMSVLTQAADLNAVMDSVLSMKEIDRKNLFLWGHSFGGWVSTYVAAQRPDEVKGLILLEPAYQIREDIMKLYPEGSEIPDEIFTPSHVGRIFVEDIQATDIFEVIPYYDKEVLLLQGSQSTGNKLQEIYYNKALETFPNITWEIVDGANHSFSGKAGERAMEKWLGYLKTNIEGFAEN